MTPSITATSVAALALSRTSTSAVNRMDQGLASGAGQWSAAMLGCSKTGASRCATTGSASSASPCSKPPAYSWLQAGSLGNSENRLLVVRPANHLRLVGCTAVEGSCLSAWEQGHDASAAGTE